MAGYYLHYVEYMRDDRISSSKKTCIPYYSIRKLFVNRSSLPYIGPYFIFLTCQMFWIHSLYMSFMHIQTHKWKKNLTTFFIGSFILTLFTLYLI